MEMLRLERSPVRRRPRSRLSRMAALACALSIFAWGRSGQGVAHAASMAGAVRGLGAAVPLIGGEDAIARLGGDLDRVAAANQVSPDVLRSRLRSDASLHVNARGRLVYVEPAEIGADDAEPSLAPGRPAAAISPAPAAPFPLDQTFHLHSRLGSKRTIHLDFDGYLMADTPWYFGGDCFATAADRDGDPSRFSDSELAWVQEVFLRVAQDYSAFEVDVTTEDPPLAVIDRAGPSDDVYGTRLVFTSSRGLCPNGKTVQQNVCPTGCGGMASHASFDVPYSHEANQPNLVFTGSVGGGAAGAASHESGHSLGLFHDGNGSSEYYGGQGSWAPVMGLPYYKTILHWSRGEYPGASNKSNDYLTMAYHGVAARTDDHGNSGTSATPLSPGVATDGVIATQADVDAFSFSTSGGSVTVTAAPAAWSRNLDLSLTLLRDDGSVVATADPSTIDAATGGSAAVLAAMGASITRTLAAGSFVVLVDGVGAGDPLATGYTDYGSIGSYAIVAGGPIPTPTATPAPTPTPEFRCPDSPIEDATCHHVTKPLASSLQLRSDPSSPSRAQLGWKWTAGDATSPDDLGDPTTSTAWRLCVYDGSSSLVAAVRLPAGGTCSKGAPCWKAVSGGFAYRDGELTPDGVQQARIKSGTDGRSSLQVSGKGALLPPVGLPLALPVTVQASNSDVGCWAAAFDASDPKARNDASTFKGRGD
ncbi:MAG: hypothetical protein ACKPBU_11735 [Alphaproteobacteria bacterium]